MGTDREQPALVSRSKPIIEVDGLRFRDLDGDGRLTPYEDWRRTPRERAEDLRGRLSVEQKAGLMIIGSHYMAGSAWVGDDGGFPSGRPSFSAAPQLDPNGTHVREQDGYSTRQPITGAPLDRPKLYASSGRGAIAERHQRRLIVRDNASAHDLAVWANALQEIAEQTEFGIPVVLTSNPRNHVTEGATLGVGEGGGVFSEWPGELGLAAIGDEKVIARFAEVARREWRAAGLHKLYGYMADVPSEPRWSRFNGTLGEDPAVVSRLIETLVRGFQGESLGPDAVALTIKHFPGGGVRTDGHDPHFAWGQDNEYPTPDSLETYQLPPFRAAVEAGVSSVMPYYSKPVNTSADQLPDDLRAPEGQFEEVAFAYNAAFLQGVLRDRLGFTGYINSDSGVLEGMAYGVEDLTPAQRVAKAVRAGTDVFSDVADPSDVVAAVRTGALDESELDRSVTLLLAEMFTLGLFENPYVDPDAAAATAADPGTRAEAEAAQRRSITLLRNDIVNDHHLLPLAPGRRVYAEVFVREGAAASTHELRKALAAHVTIVDDPAEADAAVVWVRPIISLFGGDDREGHALSVTLADRGIDVERIRAIEASAPTALVVNFLNPWVISDVEPDAAAVVATYDVSPANLAAVLTGADAPGGRLPLTVPRSPQAVADSPRDVPGMFCGPDYPYVDTAGSAYTVGFGLSY
ncbi:glycoside hydrolase family 3 protein [Microbacterium sp.]|uniref:glycoside hydrolase family 3 protein n=1 Tax=Microbacterium sp. TaxID=51671 RepID=UPI003A9041F4